MPMEFVGRDPELSALNEAYASDGSAFFPVYGRRRVGKTELILRFTEGKPAVFYLGKQAAANYQVSEFLEIAAEKLDEPLLAEIGEVGWKKALQLVAGRGPKGKKIVIVLDEFQWTTGASPELPSVIQELWDLDWSRSGNVMLILCGSYIGFMEREVLGKQSPLYGRRTGQIFLQPFGFREAAKFHPNFSQEDQTRAWFLCGGIPYYLKQFSDRRSIASNIQQNFLTPHAPLHREADFLLREELREVEHYHAVLMSLSTGLRSAAELSKETGISATSVPYYLGNLISLGYVARHHPLNGKKPIQRSVRYVLADPLLRFWFRYGFPNLSKITSLPASQSYQQLIAPNIDSYFGARFEDLCREALPDLYREDGIEASHEVGEYWDKRVQIDVVGVRSDNWIDLGECKWGTIRSWPAMSREAKGKLEAFPNPTGSSLSPWLFSRLNPKQKMRDGVRCVGLKELYGK